MMKYNNLWMLFVYFLGIAEGFMLVLIWLAVVRHG